MKIFTPHYFIFWLSIFSVGSLLGQTPQMLLMPMPPPIPDDYDKCYGRAEMPNRYEMAEVEQLVTEAYVKTLEIPAIYKMVEEVVLIKEASVEWITIPAVYEIINEQVLVKEESKVLSEQYEEVTEEILLEEEKGKWVQELDPNCTSPNSEDCIIMHWEKIPAKYKTETQKILKKLGGRYDRVLPPEYKMVTKRVMVTPPRIEERIIPAIYDTLIKQVLVEPAKTEQILVPAAYKTVLEKRLIEIGGHHDWIEILCPQKVSANVVRQVQQTLWGEGVFDGAIDGIMGPKTKQALQRFQLENNLPKGNLNKETMAALGLNYLD